MEKSKVEKMQDLLAKIEDLKNSQESIMDKCGHIQVDLFNFKDNELQKQIEEFTTMSGNNHDFISALEESYHQKVNYEHQLEHPHKE